MFNMAFPTNFIINVNSKEFSIRYGYNLLVVIYNAYFEVFTAVTTTQKTPFFNAYFVLQVMALSSGVYNAYFVLQVMALSSGVSCHMP
jgi:hypothetical protein